MPIKLQFSLDDIISWHYKEFPYFYNTVWQLHEACDKLGIITQLQVAVQNGGVSNHVEWKKSTKNAATQLDKSKSLVVTYFAPLLIVCASPGGRL